MADVSPTRNLDKFQTQFDSIKESGHEVQAKVNRRGEAFIVKGQGKSKKSRIWFAIKHPHVNKRDRNVQTKHRNVMAALKTAAKRDFGRAGPKLVDKYLQSKGLYKQGFFGKTRASYDKLSSRDVKDAITYMKSAAKFADKYKNVEIKNWDSIRGDTTLRNLMEDFLIEESSPENLYFLEDADRTLKILEGNADPSVKKAAFDLFVKRYVGNNALIQSNLPSWRAGAFRKLANMKGRLTPETLSAMKKEMKKGKTEIFKLMKRDSVRRLKKMFSEGKAALTQFKQKPDAKRSHFLLIDTKWDNRKKETVTTYSNLSHLGLDDAEDLAMDRNRIEVQNKKKEKKVAPRQVKKEEVNVQPIPVKKKAAPKKKAKVKVAPKKAPKPRDLHGDLKKSLQRVPNLRSHVGKLDKTDLDEIKAINGVTAQRAKALEILNGPKHKANI